MTKVYSVWDGNKLKGQWQGDEGRTRAVEYMALRSDPGLHLLVADADPDLDEEIDAKRKAEAERLEADRVVHEATLARHADKFPNHWKIQREMGKPIPDFVERKLRGEDVEPMPPGTVALRAKDIEARAKPKHG
jgi:hypothetical protein